MPCENCKCPKCTRKYALRKAQKAYLNDGKPPGRWKKVRAGAIRQAEAIVKERQKAAARRTAYEDYLAGPHWRATRLAAIKRDGGCCNVCESRENLHVHHGTYARVGAERPGDLVTLCDTCHFAYHYRKAQTIRVIYCEMCKSDVFQAVQLSTCRLCGEKPSQLPPSCKPPTKRTAGVLYPPEMGKARLVKPPDKSQLASESYLEWVERVR